MLISRRHVLAGAIAAPAVISFSRLANAATTLKISHQFPSSSGDEGDFRDRLVRKFAAEVEKRSNGELKFEIYPGSSLMKTNAQFSAMRKGALDMSLYPISYAGGEAPECNIGLMPCLVSSYAQGLAWKTKPVGEEFATYLDGKGIKIITWVWQAGGAASRERPLVTPADAKGMKIRGGSREMDLMLQAAGAAVLNLPSNELYVAMQTGACDAGITSSTSLISFRLEELSKNLATGKGKSYWFMLEPLLMSKTIFDKLPKAQQDLITTVGAEMEPFGLKGAQEDDVKVAEVFSKAGAKVSDLDDAVIEQWRTIARDTAWKDYAGKTALSAKLLKLAEEVQA
ncbi:C4-dicarboxylate ABC transporter [Azorhizobium oxalatiphilum]|uniref:C4-dicarboxylate ABC transporter n=1 Tax=Azorhizobium oxalatiphilum TaxID=980631 RepID=A0A917C1U4_9HYPH|nr:TRAP transporter substrate-binding protein DctP [Azorhizobium oxalatiphilum]GGF66590.1 C4-dicarboxylate ABC transporter [Azorhizobium oxalatiphilum]